MLFKDCQKGYPVFMLNRKEVTAHQGKIIDVSRPHFDTQNPSNTQMVVDVIIEVDDKQMPAYVIPENSGVAYTDSMILSTDRDTILREVQAVLSRNEEELKLIPVREKTVRQCQAIIEEWNPEVKNRRETDERISKIETALKDIQKNHTESDNKMDRILKLLESK